MEKQTLPNSTLILVFGILSLIGLCCYGILGLIFAIVALVLAKRSTEIYKESPELYTGYENVKTGKILSIITLSIIGLFILAAIILLAVYGVEGIQEVVDEAMRQQEEAQRNAMGD